MALLYPEAQVTPDSLVERGYTTATKAACAESVVGKLYGLSDECWAVLAAEVRCSWFWLLSASGEVRGVLFSDLHNARRLGHVQAAVYFERRNDCEGDRPIPEYVYTAEYGELFKALREVKA